MYSINGCIFISEVSESSLSNQGKGQKPEEKSLPTSTAVDPSPKTKVPTFLSRFFVSKANIPYPSSRIP